MKLENKHYLVMQGTMTPSGAGDLNKDSEHATLNDAIKRFNAIKRDANDWCPKGDYLVTQVIKTPDDVVGDGLFIDEDIIIEEFKVLIK